PLCSPQICMRQKDGELVAAPAGENVRLADILPDHISQVLQHAVTYNMAVVVIDLLEVVDVKHDQGKGAAIGFGVVQPFIQSIVELLAVIGAGQGILGREVKQLPVGQESLSFGGLRPTVIDIAVGEQDGLVRNDPEKLGSG